MIGANAKGQSVVLAKYLRGGGTNGGMGHGIGLLGRNSMGVTFRAGGRADVAVS
jgi:hypothetical protein